MGRITTAIGLRLGKTNSWKNFGIVIRRVTCIKYIHFLQWITVMLYLNLIYKQKFFVKKKVVQNKLKFVHNKNVVYLRQFVPYFLQIQNYIFASVYLVRGFSNLSVNIYLYKVNTLSEREYLVIKYKRLIRNFLFVKKKTKVLSSKSNKEKYFINKDKVIARKVFYMFDVKKKKKLFCRKHTFNFILKLVEQVEHVLKKGAYDIKNRRKHYLLQKCLKVCTNLVGIQEFLKVCYSGWQNGNVKNYKKLLQVGSIVSNTFSREYLAMCVYKLNILLYIQKKKLILKKYFFLRLYLQVLYKVKNKVWLSVTTLTKQDYTVRYISKKKYYNGHQFSYVFRVLYRQEGVCKKNKNCVIKKKKNYLLQTVTKRQFLRAFLWIEKLLLERSKFVLRQDAVCVFYLIANCNYTAQLLARYVCIKLKQGFILNQILRPLIQYLQRLLRKKNLLGYRLDVSGRFSRKQRATFLLFKGGTVPLGTISSKLDYAADYIVLKDGIGSVKIWLNYSEKFTKSVISLKN